MAYRFIKKEIEDTALLVDDPVIADCLRIKIDILEGKNCDLLEHIHKLRIAVVALLLVSGSLGCYIVYLIT